MSTWIKLLESTNDLYGYLKWNNGRKMFDPILSQTGWANGNIMMSSLGIGYLLIYSVYIGLHLLQMVWRRVQLVCQRTPSLPSSDWWPTSSACWWRWPISPTHFRPQRSLISNRRARIERQPTGLAPCIGRSFVGHVATYRCLWNWRWHLPWDFLSDLPRSWLRFRRRPLR